MELMLNDSIKTERYICSDVNDGLICLWNEIKNDPQKVSTEYTRMWKEMNLNDDINIKRDYFYKVRNNFNKTKSPYDFMFIMRTTTNGMPRYNKRGEFNHSFHITRSGIKPETLNKIIFQWSGLLKKNNVEFIHRNYAEIKSSQGDVLYLDPPYANTKGMYYGSLDNNELWDWIKGQHGKCFLSFDGISGDVDSTHSVPKDIYSQHKYLLNGNSGFKRTTGNSQDSIVYESLYIC